MFVREGIIILKIKIEIFMFHLKIKIQHITICEGNFMKSNFKVFLNFNTNSKKIRRYISFWKKLYFDIKTYIFHVKKKKTVLDLHN